MCFTYSIASLLLNLRAMAHPLISEQIDILSPSFNLSSLLILDTFIVSLIYSFPNIHFQAFTLFCTQCFNCIYLDLLCLNISPRLILGMCLHLLLFFVLTNNASNPLDLPKDLYEFARHTVSAFLLVKLVEVKSFLSACIFHLFSSIPNQGEVNCSFKQFVYPP